MRSPEKTHAPDVVTEIAKKILAQLVVVFDVRARIADYNESLLRVFCDYRNQEGSLPVGPNLAAVDVSLPHKGFIRAYFDEAGRVKFEYFPKRVPTPLADATIKEVPTYPAHDVQGKIYELLGKMGHKLDS